jgi:hypothetical protein
LAGVVVVVFCCADSRLMLNSSKNILAKVKIFILFFL